MLPSLRVIFPGRHATKGGGGGAGARAEVHGRLTPGGQQVLAQRLWAARPRPPFFRLLPGLHGGQDPAVLLYFCLLALYKKDRSSVADLKLLISDPAPTCQVTTNPDPDPTGYLPGHYGSKSGFPGHYGSGSELSGHYGSGSSCAGLWI